MADSTLYVRRAALATLKAAVGVTSLVPAERVYPPQRPATPTWPFIAYGSSVREPFDAACMNGSSVTVAVHNFAQTTGTGAQTLGGEEAAHRINAAIDAALDGQAIDLEAHGCPYPATAHYTCTAAQVIQDGAEADKFHGFVTLRVDVSS